MKKSLAIFLVICLSVIFIQVQVNAQEQKDVVTLWGAFKSKTVRVATTGTSTLITTLYNTKITTAIDFLTAKIKFLYISCEDAPIRYAFGTNATQNATTGVGHTLANNTSLMVPSPSMLRNMYVISKDSGANGTLQITVGY